MRLDAGKRWSRVAGVESRCRSRDIRGAQVCRPMAGPQVGGLRAFAVGPSGKPTSPHRLSSPGDGSIAAVHAPHGAGRVASRVRSAPAPVVGGVVVASEATRSATAETWSGRSSAARPPLPPCATPPRSPASPHRPRGMPTPAACVRTST
jgi:hypothetical protein